MMENKAEEKSKNWHDKSYKWLLVIPVAIFFIALVYLFIFYQNNGDIIRKDVSLTGGTSITLFDENIKAEELEASLKIDFSDVNVKTISDIRAGKQIGLVIETKAEADAIRAGVEETVGYELNQDNSSIEFSGASLSGDFYKQLRLAIIIAFILMAIVVFFIFRTFVPSLAVIFAAFADIVMTVAVVDLIGIEVSAAGIVALLMLIGYSVDTDILLTSRVLREREGTLNERIYGAFKTGITMTITAIAAIAISLAIIYSYSETLRQIFSIILIGLFFDVFNTWLTNASILKWYVEVKEKR